MAFISNIIKDNEDIEVILVNNNNKLKINQEVIKICSDFSNIKCVDCQEVGLSLARNKGISEAINNWLIFLDDDVQINASFLPIAMEIIEGNQFDCFGGMYYPWHPEGKPKWLPNDFGKKTPLRLDTGPISLPDDGFLSAGIMAIKKEVLDQVGGFRTDLGMNKGIGYGEENELQLRIQSAGYRIGFVPSWRMEHAVLAHKHKVSWHLKSAYAHGRDGSRIYKKHSLFQILFNLIRGMTLSLSIKLPIAIYRFFFQKEYYWQNALLFIWRSVFVWLGRLKGWSMLNNISNKP